MTTVQLTDRLPALIESAYEGVVDLLKEHFTEGSEFPDLSDLDYSGAVHELIDSTVPLYTNKLAELQYFHGDAAIQALIDTFGSIDGEWPMGPFAAGLYCLIEQGVSERYSDEAEDLWGEWADALDAPEFRRAAIVVVTAAAAAAAGP
jgi:hypothetical protein